MKLRLHIALTVCAATKRIDTFALCTLQQNTHCATTQLRESRNTRWTIHGMVPVSVTRICDDFIIQMWYIFVICPCFVQISISRLDNLYQWYRKKQNKNGNVGHNNLMHNACNIACQTRTNIREGRIGIESSRFLMWP